MKFSALFLVSTLLATGLYAQETEAPHTPLRVGVYTAVKAGINTSTIPSGWKTGVTMEGFPDLGLSAVINVKHAIGLSALVDVGLCSQAILIKPYPNPDDSSTMVLRSRYLCIAPSLSLPYAFLGLNVGVPLYAARVSNDGATNLRSVETTTGTVGLVNQMDLMLELRLGGILPLIEDDYGTLSAYGLLSYQLSSSFKSFSTMSPVLYGASKTQAEHDPRNASLSIGLKYVFELSSAR